MDIVHELTVGFGGYYIRRKARQLVGRAGLTTADFPDLQQELALAVFERLPSFDPRRAHWNVFLVTIVERQAVTILRARRRVKHGAHVTSLDRLVEPRHVATRQHERDAFEQVDLRNDLKVVVATLPAELRCLCDRLQFESVVEAARRIRVSRTTLYQRIKKVRRAFVRGGFS